MWHFYEAGEEDEDGPSTSSSPAKKRQRNANAAEPRAPAIDYNFPRLPTPDELCALALIAKGKKFKVYGMEVGIEPLTEEMAVTCYSVSLADGMYWVQTDAGVLGGSTLVNLWQRAVRYTMYRGEAWAPAFASWVGANKFVPPPGTTKRAWYMAGHPRCPAPAPERFTGNDPQCSARVPRNLENPWEYFESFISVDQVNTFRDATNAYAADIKYKGWRDTTTPELQSFLACLLASSKYGFHSYSYEQAFGTALGCVPSLKECFSKRRFRMLFRCFQTQIQPARPQGFERKDKRSNTFPEPPQDDSDDEGFAPSEEEGETSSDEASDEEVAAAALAGGEPPAAGTEEPARRKPLDRVRDLYEHLREVCQRLNKMGIHVAVDESMLPFKGAFSC